VLEITVLKFWYDPLWPGKDLSDDLVLAEYSLKIPLQLRWPAGEELISVELLPFASC
jgi:hypothetical protein